MKISIRTKLFLAFGSIFSVLIMMIVLLNSVFLDDFYLMKNEGTMSSTFKSIESVYKQDDAIVDFITTIDRQEGISTLIINTQHEILYNSYQKIKEAQSEKLPKEIEDFLIENAMAIHDRYAYGSTMKQEGEIPKVTFIALSKTGDLIILTKPMKGISDSVLIANQFTVLVGLMIILLGGVLMSLLANTLTKPVRSMNQVTKEIAELDFTHRVDVNTHDELGELADNINTISVKLNDSVQNLRTDIQRRKQLARDMSHELKTPISSIKGYAEGLARGIADTPEKTDHYIKVIVNECDRMDLIVRHLLDLSRLEDASIHLNKAPLLLDDLFDALKTQVEAYVTENGYTLSFANAGPLSITADKEQLKKALLNFITNAVLYGGREKQIRCYVQQEENNLDLIVFNTGDPIDEADLPKLFNLFYKVDKARTREAGGHGIGLAIVKQIAELHQGQAFARNTINGVEFILRIPA